MKKYFMPIIGQACLLLLSISMLQAEIGWGSEDGQFIEKGSSNIIDILSELEDDSQQWLIQVNPNPFSDYLFIKTVNENILFSWSIKTIDGSLVDQGSVKEKETKLSFQHLPNGLYLLELSTEKNVSIVKFIKRFS